jgi:hypothetical protein
MTEQDDSRETDVCRPATRRGTVAGKVAPCQPIVRREGEVVVIDIPMTFRRRSGRKEIVLPSGAITSAVPPKPPSPLALAVARALQWQEMIESGEAPSISDLARRLKLDTSFVARTIRLAALAPDIIGAILDGQEPDGLSLQLLRRDVPLLWDEQHRQVGLGQ